MVKENETLWVKEYIQFLRENNDVNLFTLKMQHFPSFFYKYRKLEKNTLDCLENNWLWASEPKELNDPFESSLIIDNNEVSRAFYTGNVFKNEFRKKFNYDFPIEGINEINNSEEPFKTFVSICNKKGIPIAAMPEKVYERSTSEWKKFMAEQEKLIRICCFGTSYESLLMWAHYADCHKGICIEYDFSNCSDIRVFMQPVYYSNKRSFVNSIPEMNMYSKIIASISKSKDWEYENEWRFVGFSKTRIEKMKNHLPVPKPTAIYLGGKFELNATDEKQELARIIKTKSIPTYQMINHATEYKLVKVI